MTCKPVDADIAWSRVIPGGLMVGTRHVARSLLQSFHILNLLRNIISRN